MFTGRLGEVNLTTGEDDELCYIAQLFGYEVWYSSRLHLQHHMTSGRLTEAYRDRLFYASARATPRLNAYRNALWGRADGSVGANLLKDLGYAVWGIAKNVSRPAFVRAWLAHNIVPVMNQRHALAVVREMVCHHRQVRAYYERVLRLKQHLRSSFSSPNSLIACTDS